VSRSSDDDDDDDDAKRDNHQGKGRTARAAGNPCAAPVPRPPENVDMSAINSGKPFLVMLDSHIARRP
jgi:hypothetical protein